jgi:4-hydroxy-tetrahydrodipicolinate synthase
MGRLRGVIAASITPLRADQTVDCTKLVEHCRRLLSSGCDGINLLGTTGEATSFSVDQRLEAMRAVAASRLPLARVMVGTGAASLADAATLTAAARDLGFAGALLLPPFYYKDIGAEEVFAYVEALIHRVGAGAPPIYLYHFPQLSGVPYTIETVARLHRQFPEHIAGLKDSAGDLSYSAQLAQRVPDIDVFPGTEAALAKAQEFRLAGCISATVNVTAPLAGPAFRDPEAAGAQEAFAQAAAIRAALASVPLIAAVRWALADLLADPSLATPLVPLRPLNAEEQKRLRAALGATSYEALRLAFAAAAE